MKAFENISKDIRYLTLFPRSYETPKGRSRCFWGGVDRRYANEMKRLRGSLGHWRVIEYDDGNKELAYLRVLEGGVFSGAYPAIYRGPFFPHRIGYGTFAHIRQIHIAF